MTVKEQVLTSLERLPQEQLYFLLEYIEYLHFRSSRLMPTDQPDKLPADVLIKEEAPSVLDILVTAQGQQLFKTAADVDAYLEEERSAWA